MIVKVDRPPIIENEIPKLLEILYSNFAKKQNIGYPGKCGWKSAILYLSTTLKAKRKLSISSIKNIEVNNLEAMHKKNNI